MKKVTIGITTYNLEKYITQCLDSILMQKTNFDFDIIIADDASTDATPSILIEYQKKYPNKIKLLLFKNNEGSLKTSNKLFSNIKTEYFSFIDGDDYWIDEYRLQKQVDFLDTNPDYVLVGGQTQYLQNGKLSNYVISKKHLKKTFTINDYFSNKTPFVHTSSILLRNVIFINGVPKEYFDNENTIYNCVFRGEDRRFLDHLKKGKLYIMPNIFSIYRIHDKGIWTSASKFNQIFSGLITYYYYYLNTNIESKQKKEFYYNKFLNSFRNVQNYINQFGYNLSPKDSELYTEFLNNLAKDKIINWEQLSQNLKYMPTENILKKYNKYKTLFHIMLTICFLSIIGNIALIFM